MNRNEAVPLPSDILDDLRDAFNNYSLGGFVSQVHFKSILHNFGFHSLDKKEMDDELRQHRIDLKDKDAKNFDFDTVKTVVTARLMKNGGRETEAKECFDYIDERGKNYITQADLKRVLNPSNMGFNVTELDIEEFMEIAGAQDKKIHLSELSDLYNS